MESLNQSAGDSMPAPVSAASTGTGPSFELGAPRERALGLPPITPPPAPGVRNGAVTLGPLIDAYMAAYAGRDTTRHQRLAFWIAKLGRRSIDEISEDEIFAALEQLSTQRGRYCAGKDADGKTIMRSKRKQLSPATINRYQAALSAVLTWATRQRMVPKDWRNPCKNIELKAEKNEIVRFLSDAERAALFDACRASKWPKLYLLAMLGLTTGARRGELEALRWVDVDLERAEAAVHRSKNGDKKVLPLVPAVVDELRKHRAGADSLVFASRVHPRQPYNFDGAWETALQQAGIKAFRFHDLRHSCASALAQNGATLLEIAEVLGHRQLSVTKRYSHLATAHKAALVNRVLGGFK